MKYSKPMLDVYYVAEKQDYLLQNFMEHQEYGYCMATEEFIRVDAATMRVRGLEIILDNLSRYPNRRIHMPSSIEQMTIRQRRDFEKHHSNISITLYADDCLVLTPMEIVGEEDAAEGDPTREVRVQLPCEAERFFEIMNSLLIDKPGTKNGPGSMNGE